MHPDNQAFSASALIKVFQNPRRVPNKMHQPVPFSLILSGLTQTGGLKERVKAAPLGGVRTVAIHGRYIQRRDRFRQDQGGERGKQESQVNESRYREGRKRWEGNKRGPEESIDHRISSLHRPSTPRQLEIPLQRLLERSARRAGNPQRRGEKKTEAHRRRRLGTLRGTFVTSNTTRRVGGEKRTDVR